MAATKKAMTMEQFAADVADFGDSVETANVLIYGEPGCGKTGLLGGLPGLLFLAADPNWVTAKKMGYKPKGFRRLNTHQELDAGLSWLEDGAYRDYQWVLVDGLNILQQKILFQSAREAWEENNSKRANPRQPDKPDYFFAQQAIKSMVNRLVDLPVNVVLTCHVMDVEDKDGNRSYRPHIEGRGFMVSNFVCGLMSAVGYMSNAKNARKVPVRRILWQEYSDEDKGILYFAKEQLGGVFKRFEDDMTPAQFHEAIVGSASDAPAQAETPKPRVRRAAAAATR